MAVQKNKNSSPSTKKNQQAKKKQIKQTAQATAEHLQNKTNEPTKQDNLTSQMQFVGPPAPASSIVDSVAEEPKEYQSPTYPEITGLTGNELTDDGYDIPRDFRLLDAYNTTLPLGNDMPLGEIFKGSPSIMNPYALIRFQSIANSNHHKGTFDQLSNFSIRSGSTTIPTLNTLDINLDEESQLQDNEIVINGESQKVSVIKSYEKYNTIFNEYADDVDKKNLKNSDGTDANVYVDVSGDIFILIEDRTKAIFKAKRPDSVPPGKPHTITVNTGNEQGTKYTKFDIPTDLQTSPNPKDTGNFMLPEEFWATSLELEKVKLSTGNTFNSEGGYILRSVLNKYIAKKEEGDTDVVKWEQKEINQINESFKKAYNELQKLKAAEYMFVGYSTVKKYINNPNAKEKDAKEEIQPTEDNLTNLDFWKGDEQFFYEWSDFLYCSDFYKIPNNRLITLRRFPTPCWDSGKIVNQDVTHEAQLPIARAVTWIGANDSNKLTDILSMGWTTKWKDLQASVNDVEDTSTDQAADGGLGKFSSAMQFIGKWTGDSDASITSGAAAQRAKYDPYANGPLSNEPKGPVNVIDKVMTRDVGLDFNHDITLKFYYSLKSIGGINPKIAMLDIIANFLALTYSNAPFWGGANRFFKNVHKNQFSNDSKMMDAINTQDPGKFIDAIGDQLTSALSGIGDLISNLLSDPVGALSTLAKRGAKNWLAKKSATNRPNILSFKAILTGEPVGEYHLMIGNPFNPIAMIGNLICTEANLKFPEESIGLDDFPTKVEFEVKLKHGRPRDKGDIESMFNRGQGRLHYAYRGQGSEPWNTASATRATKTSKAGKADYSNSTVMSKSQANVSDKYKQDITANRTPNIQQAPASKIHTSTRTKRVGAMSDKEYWTKIFTREAGKLEKCHNQMLTAARIGFKNKKEDQILKETGGK